VRFDGRPDDALGCRAYLAIRGGVDVPLVLGSRSTSLVGRFGGCQGRPLRQGDRIAADARDGARDDEQAATRNEHRLPSDVALPSPAQRIRLLPGPEAGRIEDLAGRPWIVARDSDRRGLRLEPASSSGAGRPPGGDAGATVPRGPAADRPSHGMVPGAIQLTPTGLPLVLMPDAGTTGGYPVIAVVISADVPLLGQLAPGDEVRFRVVDGGAARAAAVERRQLLDRLRLALRPG
jgi:antagonist of KipI